MECPYCKKEMVRGEASGERGGALWWYPTDDDGLPLTILERSLVLGKTSFLTSSGAVAHYCEGCKMVFVPVPEKQETTMDKLKKKWNDISDKMEAASEARQARQEEERKEKQREKRGKKDPWER